MGYTVQLQDGSKKQYSIAYNSMHLKRVEAEKAATKLAHAGNPVFVYARDEAVGEAGVGRVYRTVSPPLHEGAATNPIVKVIGDPDVKPLLAFAPGGGPLAHERAEWTFPEAKRGTMLLKNAGRGTVKAKLEGPSSQLFDSLEAAKTDAVAQARKDGSASIIREAWGDFDNGDEVTESAKRFRATRVQNMPGLTGPDAAKGAKLVLANGVKDAVAVVNGAGGEIVLARRFQTLETVGMGVGLLAAGVMGIVLLGALGCGPAARDRY